MLNDTQSTGPAAVREADRAHELIRRWFSDESGKLIVDGTSVAALAQQYGTPFYLYSSSVLKNNWEMLRATYPAPFEIYYSIKANPHRAFLRFFLERGCGLEVASGGELQRALAAGCPAEKILYAGPGKSNDEITIARVTYR